MSRDGAQFLADELVCVLSHYDIGVIHQVKSIEAGNRRLPKLAFLADAGKFLLKRKPAGGDQFSRVVFAHAVQRHLGRAGFPVPPVVSTRHESKTVLLRGNYVYEMFRFVAGSRYDGSPEATVNSGMQLARFHRLIATFDHSQDAVQSTFHDSTIVRRHLRSLGRHARSRHGRVYETNQRPDGRERKTAEELMALYNDASIRANKHGYGSLARQVVHGDWHPGNILFAGSEIVAVLDFDSVKIAPPVTDLANAMLQFSIVGGRPRPSDWPDYFDRDRLLQVVMGYCRDASLNEVKLDCLIDLMIETMIAEAVLPVAATGFFGHLHGLDFLKMILRKARWLNSHRGELSEAVKRQSVKSSVAG